MFFFDIQIIIIDQISQTIIMQYINFYQKNQQYMSNSANVQPQILRRYTIIKKVGSGAYGHVWKVQDKLTKKIYALKKIFDAFQHSTDAQRTFRQIQILQQTDHPNIIKLYQTFKAENNKDVYLLFQFMEADLHNVISEGILKEIHIRFIVYQIAKALKYLHSGSVLHRDLKPSNVLINSNCSIKLCDFGLVRSLINADNSNPVLTQGVATRWYRAPQVLLGSKCYSTPADIWSFGCIIYEIICQKPLFPGSSTLDQLEKIISFTGMPNQQDIKSLQSQVAKTMIKQVKNSPMGQSKFILKQVPTGFDDLLAKMLTFNPKKRITIEQILAHPIVKAFRKQNEEFVLQKQLTTSIDDNQKLTVEQYRKLIYRKNGKNLGYSSSMPAINKIPSNKKIQTAINTAKVLPPKNQSSQLVKKQTLKYVKSQKQFNKSQNESTKYLVKPQYRKSQKVQSKTTTFGKDSQKEYKTVYSTATSFYSPKNTQIKKGSVNCCPWNYGSKQASKVIQASKINKQSYQPDKKI